MKGDEGLSELRAGIGVVGVRFHSKLSGISGIHADYRKPVPSSHLDVCMQSVLHMLGLQMEIDPQFGRYGGLSISPPSMSIAVTTS